MENMTLLKVKCKIFPEDGELNPDLEPAGSRKCLGTISALCILKTGRKSLVQRCSWRLREETALFDLVNVWGLMKPWYGWGGGRPALGMGGRERCCCHVSLLEDTKLKASE